MEAPRAAAAGAQEVGREAETAVVRAVVGRVAHVAAAVVAATVDATEAARAGHT